MRRAAVVCTALFLCYAVARRKMYRAWMGSTRSVRRCVDAGAEIAGAAKTLGRSCRRLRGGDVVRVRKDIWVMDGEWFYG